MADRASVTIRIGGRLSRAGLRDLAALAEAARACRDYEDTPFDPDDIEAGVLTLVANEVAWGRLDDIEGFCIARGPPFARWAGSAPGAFEPERVVFDGTGQPRWFAATDDNAGGDARDTARARLNGGDRDLFRGGRPRLAAARDHRRLNCRAAARTGDSP